MNAAAPERLVLAGRFRTAAAALACLGGLTAAQRGHGAEIMRDTDSWWVIVRVELDIGRAAIHAARGIVHVETSGGLVRDRGFGPAPSPTLDAADRRTLTAVPLIELVRAGGLFPVAPLPLREATLILAGIAAATAVRRALDFGLTVEHR